MPVKAYYSDGLLGEELAEIERRWKLV